MKKFNLIFGLIHYYKWTCNAQDSIKITELQKDSYTIRIDWDNDTVTASDNLPFNDNTFILSNGATVIGFNGEILDPAVGEEN